MVDNENSHDIDTNSVVTTKKVYHLKTWPKVVVVLIILIAIGCYYGNIEYQKYLYTQTDEYKMLEMGYTEDEIKLFYERLTDEQIDKIMSYEYNEFIPMFINTKYFLFKNLDAYLEQVITQEQDFFKYRGTDGYDYEKLVTLVNVHANNNFYENTVETDMSQGYGILVNKFYKLAGEYEPDDLVEISNKYRYVDTKMIRSDVYDAFVEMWEAAHEEGIYLLVESAYRSYSQQEKIYKDYENNKGTKYADSIAARPGYSEHQTGLSLDIYSKECYKQSEFKDSKTYAWLIENSYKYGFILRYPEGKEDITGYNYESWHYRYLGKDLAKKVYDSGLTYEEYYAYYIEGDK